jgi:hypothetical protein
MKHEPKWGRNAILQLNWVFDEFFVEPSIWKAIFKPLGIASREVLDAKTEKPFHTVVQIVISEQVDAVLDGEPKQSCPVCHRPKYEPHVRGPFPQLRTTPKAHAAKTEQYFGSGGQAYQSVLVSREPFQAISEHKVRGVSFQPVQS